MNAHAPAAEAAPEPLPANLAAEQALLGAIFVNNDALHRVSGFLRGEHFSEPIHGQVYDAAMRRAEKGDRVNPITMRDALPADLAIGDMDGYRYLVWLMGQATTVLNAEDFARAIHDAAIRRDLITLADDVRARAGGGADLEEIAEDSIAALDTVMQARARGATPRVSMGRAAREAIAGVVAAKVAGTGLSGATWGIPSLDRLTGGMGRGDLIVEAARPGVGKTAKGIAVALKTAAAGNGVYFVSLEMVAQQLALRAATAIASGYGPPIMYEKAAKGFSTDQEIERLNAGAERLERLPIVIEQEPGLTVSQIAARARQVRREMRRRGQDLAVIVVDHIGLIKPGGRYEGNKVAETEDVTGALKRMAKQLDVAVLALCQLSRAVEGRDDKRPTLADLRWSGGIEQDADIVIGLFREAYYLGKKKNQSPADVERMTDVQFLMEAEILKQRMGRTDRVELYCQIGANVIDEMRRG